MSSLSRKQAKLIRELHRARNGQNVACNQRRKRLEASQHGKQCDDFSSQHFSRQALCPGRVAMLMMTRVWMPS